MSLQLIVNADDYGRSAGVSRGIREAHKHGIVTSTSCMMNFPNVEADILLAKEQTPDLQLGVHLVLTSGYPLSAPKQVRTLLTEEYRFPNLEQFLSGLANVDVTEVKQEWRRQIEKFVRITGHTPTHLDSHHHSSYYTKGFFQAMLELAQEFSCAIRQVTAQDSDFLSGLPHELSGDIQEFAPRLIREFAIRTTDAFFASFYDDHATQEELLGILDRLPASGIYELMCHPGYADAALDATTIYSRQRENELAVLTAKAIQEKIAACQIELVSFAAL